MKVDKWVLYFLGGFICHECILANVYDSNPKTYYDWFCMTIRQFQFGSVSTMSLPAKIASIAFGLVILLPIFALLIVAGIVAAFVFGVLLLVHVVRVKIKSLFNKNTDIGPNAQGRKNVRVRKNNQP